VSRGQGLYDDPEVYDILHAPGTAAEVRGLERMARRFVGPVPLTWLEPACGTGRYLRALAERGHRCIGFDLSAEMVGYARRSSTGKRHQGPQTSRHRGARFWVAEMTDFAEAVRRRIDVAFNLINTVRHLETDRAMVRHLREMREALRPRGVYLVGISLTQYGLEIPSEDVWEGRRDGVRVKQVVQFIPPLLETQRRERAQCHLVVTRAGREEHRDSRYWLRCYGREQWERVVSRGGFEPAAVVDAEGREKRTPSWGYGVWVLRPASGPDGRFTPL
jgi:SAM-dependent methyltransferase